MPSYTYLDENGLARVWNKLKAYFVAKTQTINGKALSGNVTLKAADFSSAVTNQNMLAALNYSEPRENEIRVLGKTFAGEFVTMPYGLNLNQVLRKGEITVDPGTDTWESDATAEEKEAIKNTALIAVYDGTYKVALSATTVFPIRYGTLFVTTAGATYKLFIMVGTTGGLWYRVANYAESTWYDVWVQASVKSDLLVPETNTFEPTFSWSDDPNAPSISDKAFTYTKYGKLIYISGSFTYDEQTAPSKASRLVITLPTEIRLVGPTSYILGELFTTGVEDKDNLLVRRISTGLDIVTGVGAGSTSNRLSPGSYRFYVSGITAT